MITLCGRSYIDKRKLNMSKISTNEDNEKNDSYSVKSGLKLVRSFSIAPMMDWSD